MGVIPFPLPLARDARRLRRISGAGARWRHAGRVGALCARRAPRRSRGAGVDRGHGSSRASLARLGRRRTHHRPARCGRPAGECGIDYATRRVFPVPALSDIYAARSRVYRVVRPTPLLRHPLLARETGLDILVKHENHNPTCAFKVRGGLNLIGQLAASERKGVITATTGNHGQSIALACERDGVPCTIVTPVGNNPEKNAAMRALGATVIEFVKDFDEAREKVEQVQAEQGLRCVHSANEPALIAGVGTYALEIFEAQPDTDVILVPIGGGSGACGCGIVRSGLGSDARVVGVQAARADAFTRSWRGAERVVGERADTFGRGMATLGTV